MNELTVFQNPEFGEVRTLERKGNRGLFSRTYAMHYT